MSLAWELESFSLLEEEKTLLTALSIAAIPKVVAATEVEAFCFPFSDSIGLFAFLFFDIDIDVDIFVLAQVEEFFFFSNFVFPLTLAGK